MYTVNRVLINRLHRILVDIDSVYMDLEAAVTLGTSDKLGDVGEHLTRLDQAITLVDDVRYDLDRAVRA